MTGPVLSILGGILVLLAFPAARRLADHLLARADHAWSASSRDWARASAAPVEVMTSIEALTLSGHPALEPRIQWALRGFWAVATAAALWGSESPVQAGLLLVASLTLLVAALADLRAKILPEPCVALFAACGVLACLLDHGPLPSDALVGALVGFSAFFTLQIGFRLLRGKEMLGLGDVKLFAAAGLWVGWQGLAMVGLIGSLLGILQFAVTKGSDDRAIAFGPALALATLVVLGFLSAS
ncbi:MAG: A24 family peptidase [Pseudomonadota bacterium]